MELVGVKRDQKIKNQQISVLQYPFSEVKTGKLMVRIKEGQEFLNKSCALNPIELGDQVFGNHYNFSGLGPPQTNTKNGLFQCHCHYWKTAMF